MNIFAFITVAYVIGLMIFDLYLYLRYVNEAKELNVYSLWTLLPGGGLYLYGAVIGARYKWNG